MFIFNPLFLTTMFIGVTLIFYQLYMNIVGNMTILTTILSILIMTVYGITLYRLIMIWIDYIFKKFDVDN